MSVRVPKKKPANHNLPLIKCTLCGAKIMLLPNVKLMSEAIEAHVEKHKHKIKDLTEAESEGLRENLIAQVLDNASKSKKK